MCVYFCKFLCSAVGMSLAICFFVLPLLLMYFNDSSMITDNSLNFPSTINLALHQCIFCLMLVRFKNHFFYIIQFVACHFSILFAHPLLPSAFIIPPILHILSLSVNNNLNWSFMMMSCMQMALSIMS